ncbi:phosphocholine cytidylyltransferase family protein [Stakelama sp. CBK3Z-3]|uniref:Phosphocholine cytidylyltransferase family protein n=1 Tax=Stakelama flava TaxID=2860338 RepID=A0ABS6XM54_9SPHN|nr:phosphocholine cytidylyltransferase family protein [Stakelama flava]MBW4331293.1 phosphocholine cytidylyltransferase family protein [Stakelama flava]
MIEKAIILSAGQGSRLLPLTADRPKCLIDFSGKTLIAWQVEMLSRAGVTDFHVVTGFMTDMVEAELDTLRCNGRSITVHFNPFYKVADNLGSCWIARDAMEGDFVILNGDTLVSEEIVRTVIGNETDWPIAVTVDVKPAYDSDDMKVSRLGEKLLAIGKTLSAEQSNAESIGFLAFRGEGPALFRETVRAVMRTPAGVANWYLKIIDMIAPDGKVGTCSIEGMDWAEVDFLNDIEIATRLTDRWA